MNARNRRTAEGHSCGGAIAMPGNPRLVLRLKSAVLVALVILCAPVFAQDSPSPLPPGLPGIVVTSVSERQLTDRVITSGTIRPVDEVYVQPLVDGLPIRVLNVDVGDRVEANGVLAILDDDTLLLQKSRYQANKVRAEATLAQSKARAIEAQASLDDAIRQRDRTRLLGRTGTSSVSQVEQADAQAEIASARLNAARQAVGVAEADIKVADAEIADTVLKLARTDIRTPGAGIVSVRNARIGAIAVGSSDPLFTIIRDGAIELVADMAETDIRKIRIGQAAMVHIAGRRNGIEGKVRLVSPTIDATTRFGAVHVVIDATSGARSGMYASAEIIVARMTTLALPQSAITMGREGTVARKVEGNVIRQVKIGTGIQDSGFIEVTSGLSPGDKVVAKAGAFVRNGDRIMPIEVNNAETGDDTTQGQAPNRGVTR